MADDFGKENNGSAPRGYTGETDRSSGEYHYKNGYTQTIYSDARYSPADESTVPPHFYTPPEKSPRETKHTVKQISAAALVFACLACAIVGGFCGAHYTTVRMSDRVAALEKGEAALKTDVEKLTEQSEVQPSPVIAGTGLAYSGSSGEFESFYEQACRQTVSITIEATYTNLFGQQNTAFASGTGLIVTADGYIVTNYHVIQYAFESDHSVSVMLWDGSGYPAQVVGADEANDIAVLKIEASGLTPAVIGNSNSLTVGDNVSVVGNPLGELNFSVTFGRIGALDRQITGEDGLGAINMFQIDASVNPGNSGGPVYNQSGQVVGIVTARYDSAEVEGIGFAIPINDAARIADDIITNGYVTGKAGLGLSCDERYTTVYSQFYGYPMGAYIKSVTAGSCAEKAGLRSGDIITAVGSYVIDDYGELYKAVRHYSAQDVTTVTFYRDGSYATVEVVFDEADASIRSAPTDGTV